jgi:hypothetical protein
VLEAVPTGSPVFASKCRSVVNQKRVESSKWKFVWLHDRDTDPHTRMESSRGLEFSTLLTEPEGIENKDVRAGRHKSRMSTSHSCGFRARSTLRVARNSPGVVQRERRFWRTSQSMTTGCCWALLPEDNDDRIRPRLALRCGTKQKTPGSRRGLCSVRE